MGEWHEVLANIATTISLPIAAAAIWQAVASQRRSTAIARGTFMLEIEKMLSIHDPVHIKLRPGGEWSEGTAGPKTAKEWAAVEDYMGMFEHCELLMQDGAVDPDAFSKLFRYRVSNIINNGYIVQGKLITEQSSWTTFVQLCRRLAIEVPTLPGASSGIS